MNMEIKLQGRDCPDSLLYLLQVAASGGKTWRTRLDSVLRNPQTAHRHKSITIRCGPADLKYKKPSQVFVCARASCGLSVCHDLNRECDIWNSPFSMFVCVRAYVIFANMLQFLVDLRCVCWQKVAWAASGASYFSCPTVIFSAYSFNKPVMAHAVSWSCVSFQGKKYSSWYLLKGALCFKMYEKNSFCIRSPSRWQFSPWRCLRLTSFFKLHHEKKYEGDDSHFFFFSSSFICRKMRRDDDRWEWEDHKSSHHAVWPKHGKKQYRQINASVSLKPYLRVLKIKRAASSPHKAMAGEGAALQLIFFPERAMNPWPLELFLLWRRAPQLFVFPERKQSF